MTCMAVGGKVDGSSLTGPASENLGQLQPLMYQEDLRGANKYSISVMRTGATHGDVFTCRASNNVSSPSANLTLSGIYSAAITHYFCTTAQHTSLLDET